MRYPMEPFRIKMTESVRPITRAMRLEHLAEAQYNLFRLKSEHVLIDLLTDSGTGAMSSAQWAALLRGDEAYAGSTSYYRFAETITRITGYPHVIPTHQGRAAEHLVMSALRVTNRIVVNNTHFDTTRANILALGGTPVDLPCQEASSTTTPAPFKGNMNIAALQDLLSSKKDEIAAVMATITNNAQGGQPVSLENLQQVASLAHEAGLPFFLDACRFAENAYLARLHDTRLGRQNLYEVARAYFDLADGCLVSAKKNGLANIGGFFATRDADLAERVRELMVVTEGFSTYGGLAGRDMEAIATGLDEALDETYMAYRTGVVAWLAESLEVLGVPVVKPAGGHAVFVDAGAWLSHIPKHHFPAQALACALYLEGGVRTVEIGSLMFEEDARHELVRLAIPHRTYTRSHLEHVVDTFARIGEHREHQHGYRIVRAPRLLRHFTASLEPITPAPCVGSPAEQALPGTDD